MNLCIVALAVCMAFFGTSGAAQAKTNRLVNDGTNIVWDIQNGPFQNDLAFAIGFRNNRDFDTGLELLGLFTNTSRSRIKAIYVNGAAFPGTDDSLGSLLWSQDTGETDATALHDYRGYFGVIDRDFIGNLVARDPSGGTDTWGFKTTNELRQIAAIPEPSTWVMMLLGFGFVAMRLQRKTRMVIATA